MQFIKAQISRVSPGSQALTAFGEIKNKKEKET